MCRPEFRSEHDKPDRRHDPFDYGLHPAPPDIEDEDYHDHKAKEVGVYLQQVARLAIEETVHGGDELGVAAVPAEQDAVVVAVLIAGGEHGPTGAGLAARARPGP